jgi:integrase/recombinase XerD
MATLMHENGADIRHIQAMLGHEDIRTTEIYTQVAIRALQKIHAATHPAAMLERGESLPTKAADPDAEALFSALEAEAEEDRE